MMHPIRNNNANCANNINSHIEYCHSDEKERNEMDCRRYGIVIFVSSLNFIIIGENSKANHSKKFNRIPL